MVSTQLPSRWRGGFFASETLSASFWFNRQRHPFLFIICTLNKRKTSTFMNRSYHMSYLLTNIELKSLTANQSTMIFLYQTRIPFFLFLLCSISFVFSLFSLEESSPPESVCEFWAASCEQLSKSSSFSDSTDWGGGDLLLLCRLNAWVTSTTSLSVGQLVASLKSLAWNQH